jgi:DNA-binding CsgD family transcriptional regulator
VDARAEQALAELVRHVMSRDLDELYTRLERLERQLAPPVTRREYLEARKRRAAELRRSGLNTADVARRLGIARSTAARDLNATSRKNGSRPSA